MRHPTNDRELLAMMAATILAGDFGYHYPAVLTDSNARELHVAWACRGAREILKEFDFLADVEKRCENTKPLIPRPPKKKK